MSDRRKRQLPLVKCEDGVERYTRDNNDGVMRWDEREGTRRMMASDVIGKGGDTISREQAIGALEGELLAYPDNRVRYNTNRDAIAMLRALPAIAPDAVEAEYREAAVDLMSQAQHAADRFTGMAREIFGQSNFTDRYDDEGRCRNHANALQEKIDRFAAARAARDARCDCGKTMEACADTEDCSGQSMPASEVRCPTCASDDPRFMNPTRSTTDGEGNVLRDCPDPFHNLTKPTGSACPNCAKAEALDGVEVEL